LPPDSSEERIKKIYEGIREISAEFDTNIVGGETTTCASGLMLSISMIGTVGKTKFVCRTGSQIGDAIFVSGELGGSIAGRHLDFIPRLAEAQWLADHFQIHAMIDLSDGLAGDLKHLLTPDAPGAELLKTSLPVSRAARLRSRNGDSDKPPVVAALTDGEDYELLFTVASKDAVAMLDGWKSRFPGTLLTCIGKIVETPGIHLRDQYHTHRINLNGYEHFS
jgi:thiamine-monophosphate kinase